MSQSFQGLTPITIQTIQLIFHLISRLLHQHVIQFDFKLMILYVVLIHLL
jgi:hypothetical protein